MSTQIVLLDNHAWTLAYSGPTTQPISVEPCTNPGSMWLAISDATPQFFAAGHPLYFGDLRAVELSEGEHLYVYAAPLARSQCSLVITD